MKTDKTFFFYFDRSSKVNFNKCTVSLLFCRGTIRSDVMSSTVLMTMALDKEPIVRSLSAVGAWTRRPCPRRRQEQGRDNDTVGTRTSTGASYWWPMVLNGEGSTGRYCNTEVCELLISEMKKVLKLIKCEDRFYSYYIVFCIHYF